MKTLLALTAALAFLAPAAQERLAANLIFDAVDSGDPVRVKKVLDAQPKLAAHKDAQGYTPLHRAAGRHSAEVVKLLLDAGADVNAKANDDHTPLHRAAYSGSKDAVALLLARGADANAATKEYRSTPLHWATERGHVGIMALLLAKGASPDAGWKPKEFEPRLTPLHHAVRGGHLDAARLLLAKGATVDPSPLGISPTPLDEAVSRDDLEMVKLLLRKGANPNQENSLFGALGGGRPEMIRAFIDAGAVLKPEPQVLMYAAASGKTGMVELVLAKSGLVLTDSENHGMRALHHAAYYGSTDVVRLLLEKRVDPNIVGKGRPPTPLHVAARKEIAELLLAHKAKLDEPDGQGITPMVAAVRRGNKPVAQLLSDHGAKHTLETLAALGRDDELKERLKKEPLKNEPLPKAKEPARPTLLHTAIFFEQFASARVLLDAGADVNAAADLIFNLGETPLHSAAARGNLPLVELLLERKAAVNAKMKEPTYGYGPPGRITPLMVALDHGHADVVRVLAKAGGLPAIDGAKNAAALLPDAAKRGHWAVARLLIERGAPLDTRMPHHEDTTTLHLAAEAGDLEMVKWLVARKADLTSLDLRRWTPLTRAVTGGHTEVAKFLLAQGASARDGSLFRAAAGGHVALVEMLLKHGADRDAVFDHHGYTALGYAAAEGKIAVVKLLHEKGASVKKDVGILHDAAFRGHREVVAFLLDKGAGVEEFRADGYDLYREAFPTSRSSVLTLFAETDPAKFATTPRTIVTIEEINGGKRCVIVGGRPLQAAVAGRQNAVAALLLERGASAKVLFPDGSTLLHLAAELGDAEMAALLLKHGTPLAARNRNGRTALGVALERADEDMAALLRKHGAER